MAAATALSSTGCQVRMASAVSAPAQNHCRRSISRRAISRHRTITVFSRGPAVASLRKLAKVRNNAGAITPARRERKASRASTLSAATAAADASR